jgi:hypothetical protein
LTGRIVDRQGQGVAGIVVAIQSDDHSDLFAFRIVIATAVRTDEAGRFTLPPFLGRCRVWLTDRAPDYSRQFLVMGAKPPPILPQRIALDGVDETQEIEFREGESVTVRGTVRWADGSPVPDIEIKSYMLPSGWESGTDLASIRTDREGRYELRLPAPAERVHVSIPQSIRAPDGTFQQARLAGPAADPFNQERVLTFNVLTGDVENADWVVNSAEAKKP